MYKWRDGREVVVYGIDNWTGAILATRESD